jgi:SAM-dependent methyltransferase
MDFGRWQASWDAQQQAYLGDREERFSVMLDVLELIGPAEPRVLDLAGGTGSITRRVLERFPRASSVVLDMDPVLLEIAAGSAKDDPRVRVCLADLREPGFVAKLASAAGEERFDAVLTATALHWLEADQVETLYRALVSLIAPGGMFANADHLPDPGLDRLAGPFHELRLARTERRRARGAVPDWESWWAEVLSDPELANAAQERERLLGPFASSHHTHTRHSSTSHIEALREAGFADVGLIWRSLEDAVVLGITER